MLTTFKFKYDPLIHKYVPELPMPHDACIRKVIEIIKRCEGISILEMNSEITRVKDPGVALYKSNVVDRFRDTCAQISSGYIARLLLNAICTFQVCKNWNLHGATLGATLCQLGSMLSGLDSASKREIINVDFNELIPQGNVQTGHKHGHHEVSYIEYMTLGKERSVVTGAEELYLDHMKFRGDHHDVKVCEIMSKELPLHKAPVPRPTRAHTFDFNLSYNGAHLLDGECKGSASESEKAILVFHSLDQLAFKDQALSLLTTNNLFIFYVSWLVDRPNYVQTCFHELRKFKLGPVANINVDLDKDAAHLQTPPHFTIKGDGQEFVETDTDILKVWKELRSKVRQFMCTMMHAVDILEAVSTMEIEKISERWKTGL